MEQIAMYLRLSKEDEFIRDESNSITNHRAFIRSYINKDNTLRKMNVLEFVDDGYTGKNMDRPDMQRMLDLVKRKQISCVIVKDFSRFSRDHIEQGNISSRYFLLWVCVLLLSMTITIVQIMWEVSVKLMLHLREFFMIFSVRNSR